MSSILIIHFRAAYFDANVLKFLFHSDSIIALMAVCHSGFVAFLVLGFFSPKCTCYLALGLGSSFSPHKLM